MTCAEKGLAYELVPVRYGSEEHGALHPFRRMPILEVGETVIFETLAATGYVDEAFDGPSLQPADPAGRAAMRTWMGVCGDYLFRQVVRGIPRDRIGQRGAIRRVRRERRLRPDTKRITAFQMQLNASRRVLIARRSSRHRSGAR